MSALKIGTGIAAGSLLGTLGLVVPFTLMFSASGPNVGKIFLGSSLVILSGIAGGAYLLGGKEPGSFARGVMYGTPLVPLFYGTAIAASELSRKTPAFSGETCPAILAANSL
jgi:hypothetical protein